MTTFGEVIGARMREKQFVQQTLAAAVGVHQTFIGKLIRGEKGRLGADVFVRLCEVLELDLNEMAPLVKGDVGKPSTAPDKGKPKGKKR